jgi:formylmethanofuran:tetrahydromethanopterin formyltransferase
LAELTAKAACPHVEWPRCMCKGYGSRSEPATIEPMRIGTTEIVDTYAEAFGVRYTRLIISAANDFWLDAALRSITGYATSVIGCDAEVGVERRLPKGESPDGRPAAAVLLFGFTAETVTQAAQHRVGQCILTCPTTACFNGLHDATDSYSLGKYLRYFGDGFEEKGGRQRAESQKPSLALSPQLLALGNSGGSPLWTASF